MNEWVEKLEEYALVDENDMALLQECMDVMPWNELAPLIRELEYIVTSLDKELITFEEADAGIRVLIEEAHWGLL